MNPDETALETAIRHVAEEEARVARQTGLIADLASKGIDTAEAQSLLGLLKDTLRLMYENLAHQQERIRCQPAR